MKEKYIKLVIAILMSITHTDHINTSENLTPQQRARIIDVRRRDINWEKGRVTIWAHRLNLYALRLWTTFHQQEDGSLVATDGKRYQILLQGKDIPAINCEHCRPQIDTNNGSGALVFRFAFEQPQFIPNSTTANSRND